MIITVVSGGLPACLCLVTGHLPPTPPSTLLTLSVSYASWCFFFQLVVVIDLKSLLHLWSASLSPRHDRAILCDIFWYVCFMGSHLVSTPSCFCFFWLFPSTLLLVVWCGGGGGYFSVTAVNEVHKLNAPALFNVLFYINLKHVYLEIIFLLLSFLLQHIAATMDKIFSSVWHYNMNRFLVLARFTSWQEHLPR